MKISKSDIEKIGLTSSKTYKRAGIKYRMCSVCGEEKEANLNNFSPQKIKTKYGTTWNGLRPDCKVCRREKAREKRNER